MKYNVGQVLYLLSKKNSKIVPARVESIVTVTKRSGIEVTHELSVPGATKTAVLEKLDVAPFSDAKDLRSHMLGILQEKVDLEISNVLELAEMAWPDESISQDTDIENDVTPEISQNADSEKTVQVALPNGQTARVHMPKDLM